MKIKSFYAATIADAIASARRELGPEAMILASRKTTGETSHLGQYEIVFGVTEAETLPVAAPAPPPIAPTNEPGIDTKPAPEDGMARLRKHVDSLRSNMNRKAPTRRDTPRPQPQLQAQLINEGLHPEIAEEIASAVKVRIGVSGQQEITPEAIANALTRELHGRLQAAPVLGRPRASRRIVALVGPAGAGKTSTLVKLAVQHGLAKGLPIRLISIDTYRLAASGLLQGYAASMGLELERIDTADALDQAILNHKAPELLFIDTPGYALGNLKPAEEFASVLSGHAEVDVHLVLPAYMNARDMARQADAYRMFLPSKLIFSKLDESVSRGALVSELVRQEKPVSFLGTGQQVPDDVEEASVDRLIANFAALRSAEAVSAA